MARRKLLVVGATGQLGTEIVHQALLAGRPVKALVRRTSNFSHLEELGAEIAFGDLRDRTSLVEACSDVGPVISTATVVFPHGKYSFAEDEDKGYRNLLSACRETSVERLAFVSLLMDDTPDRTAFVPNLGFKRRVERAIVESGIPYTIVRPSLFMDDYFV